MVKVSIQSFRVAIVVNLKRLVKLTFLAATEPRLACAAYEPELQKILLQNLKIESTGQNLSLQNKIRG